MYKLYYMPGACSRAVHALLNELEQPVELIPRDSAADFRQLNPTNQVPVLVDGDLVLREGSAIVLHLLEKHRSPTLPDDSRQRSEFYQWLLFANATLHPAYSLLFFAKLGLEGDAARKEVFDKGAARLSALWDSVEERLRDKPFIFGDTPTAVDMMLAVYADWNQHFPVEIALGDSTRQMIARVQAHPPFSLAVERERDAAVA
ncbi:glutathione S-transferase family protein [Microbulbifer halophilus]|uniref:Glutathione S-transferase family protein n=1 Tax=Microbulbifer halophilus TaxID=453963 RepID=A0ABW5E986_9GAMM|nr:glutathione S-transferase family protein [Microbulbifer halophilus]MCW8125365.1 glutathione S-transferase family protein [Microbulbifer halophilus]